MPKKPVQFKKFMFKGGQMYRYVIKRLLMLIPVILGVILMIFIVMDLAPGDPVLMIASPDATEEELDALRT